MSEGNGGAEFSVGLPPREVRQMAHRHMLNQGFTIASNLTTDAVEYSVVRQRKLPLRLIGISPDFYRVRLSIREEGKGRTHLTLKTAHRGRWEGMRHEIEGWIIEELEGDPATGR